MLKEIRIILSPWKCTHRNKERLERRKWKINYEPHETLRISKSNKSKNHAYMMIYPVLSMAGGQKSAM